MTRVAIRGYQDGEQVLYERIDADETDLEALAEEHALRLVGALRGMARPIRLDL